MNALHTSAVPAPGGAGTAELTDTITLAKETPAVPNPIESHRPVSLFYSTPDVTVVPNAIAAAPKVTCGITASNIAPYGALYAGPLQLRFVDSASARLWASALEVLAAQLGLAEEHAADLRSTEMDAAAAEADQLAGADDEWIYAEGSAA